MKKHHFEPYIAAGISAFCVIAAAIFLYFLLSWSSKIAAFLGTLAYILRPIFIGMVIAFLLLPIQNHIYEFLVETVGGSGAKPVRRDGLLRLIAIVCSLLLAIFIIYLLLAMVIPQLYFSIVGLVNAFPGYIRQVSANLQDFLKDNPEIQGMVMSAYNSAAASFQNWLNADILPNLQSITDSINWVRTTILPNLTGVVSNVSAAVVYVLLLAKDILIAIIVSIYLLARKDTFAAQSKKIVYSIFPTRVADLLVAETRSAYHILSGFINGKLVDSLIIGIITLICCNLLKFPYPALVATVIGVTNVIPFFGPFIGAVPCAVLILLVNPIQCLQFVVFIFILQQFDGNILGPKILGDSTGLASFWVLFSILLFGGLFGFAGMVLGVPVFAMFYSVVRRLVHRGLRRHGLPEDTEHYVGPIGPQAHPKSREQEP